jgi:hypothetical protein
MALAITEQQYIDAYRTRSTAARGSTGKGTRLGGISFSSLGGAETITYVPPKTVAPPAAPSEPTDDDLRG